MTKVISQPGGPILTAEGLHWETGQVVRFGMSWNQVMRRNKRSQKFMMGQYWGIVDPGLIMAKTIFIGLRRGMYVNGNVAADKEKLAYCWTPNADYEMVGTTFYSDKKEYPAPDGCVFVVIISPNENTENYPEIAGWIEHWSWTDACPNTEHCPVNHETRYDDKLK